MPPERGRKPFQPVPCIFQATLPPSCSVQISSEQVHQEGFPVLDARAITSHSGLRLPCGDWSLSGVVMPSQHTKWWLPSAGKQCWVSGEVRSSEPHGWGGLGSAAVRVVSRHATATTKLYKAGPRGLRMRTIVMLSARCRAAMATKCKQRCSQAGRPCVKERLCRLQACSTCRRGCCSMCTRLMLLRKQLSKRQGRTHGIYLLP